MIIHKIDRDTTNPTMLMSISVRNTKKQGRSECVVSCLESHLRSTLERFESRVPRLANTTALECPRLYRNERSLSVPERFQSFRVLEWNAVIFRKLSRFLLSKSILRLNADYGDNYDKAHSLERRATNLDLPPTPEY